MPTILKTSKNTLNKDELTKARKGPKKVFVGMSGGVDSSVAALLLKKAGYDVTGVFIKVWQPEDTDCGWKDERRGAMRVAAVLDIPFLTLDFSKEYKQEVVDYMISEYKAGRTPNPDVMRNRYIKFGSFLKEALKRGAHYVATGHYAENVQDSSSGAFLLRESKDENKDQSYFLWTLEQDDLRHILFPVGHMKKDELRKMAEKNSIPIFDKKDSQGICFIGHVDIKEFLKQYIETKKGDVLDVAGRVIGTHDGAALYTAGERHGFTIFNKGEKGAKGEAHYIISRNVAKNTITVAPESAFGKKSTFKELAVPRSATLLNVNWILGKAPTAAKKYKARIRYRQELQACKLKTGKSGVTITFDKPQKGMAEGQSAVIYDGSVCLGGGILGAIS